MIKESFNPYDLSAVAEIENAHNRKPVLKRHLKDKGIEKRIRRIKSLYGDVNPYDLEQIAYIFRGANPNDFRSSNLFG